MRKRHQRNHLVFKTVLLCKQAEIQCKSLFWLRFRISDTAKCVPKMFLTEF